MNWDFITASLACNWIDCVDWISRCTQWPCGPISDKSVNDRRKFCVHFVASNCVCDNYQFYNDFMILDRWLSIQVLNNWSQVTALTHRGSDGSTWNMSVRLTQIVQINCIELCNREKTLFRLSRPDVVSTFFRCADIMFQVDHSLRPIRAINARNALVITRKNNNSSTLQTLERQTVFKFMIDLRCIFTLYEEKSVWFALSLAASYIWLVKFFK